jgi:F0F1-type ATP synthase assembly protein I
MAFLRKSDAAMFRTAYELSAGVLSFVIALGIGWWLGRTLDRWLGISPWMTVVGSVFGLVAGALNVVRTVKQALATERMATPDPDRRPPPASRE